MAATTVSSSSTPNPKFTSQIHPKRAPLLPPSSDPPSSTITIHRKPKSRAVTSRYLTSTPHRPSPPTTPAMSAPRSRSADRRRPPSSATASERMMMSASFNGTTTPVGRRRREREGDENVRPREGEFTTRRREGDENVRMREGEFTTRRSFECGDTNNGRKVDGRRVARALEMKERSMEEKEEEGSTMSSCGSGSTTASDFATSDAESVSSRRPRAMAVPARFWQETANRIRRLPEQNSAKMSFDDSKLVSSSPRVPSARGSSPNKVLSAMSPSRGRSVIRTNDYVSNTPSVSSFAADTRRGKAGDNKISDMHELKMLHNRQLQWQFANARANAAMQTQKDTAEKSINCAREKISELRDSVGSKRVELQHVRQQLKLYSVLEKQMPYLDEWEPFDGDYSSSLAGAVESLVSSTLRLPLVGGAKANFQELEETISSAVDVMHGIGSSLWGLLDKVVQTNTLASELANISRNEFSSLDQCNDLLTNLTAMQVEDCCLRTQRLQLSHVHP